MDRKWLEIINNYSDRISWQNYYLDKFEYCAAKHKLNIHLIRCDAEIQVTKFDAMFAGAVSVTNIFRQASASSVPNWNTSLAVPHRRVELFVVLSARAFSQLYSLLQLQSMRWIHHTHKLKWHAMMSVYRLIHSSAPSNHSRIETIEAYVSPYAWPWSPVLRQKLIQN